ncbi:BREX-1 system phosphatase PglZ type B [Roseomonas stagni]|uniref:BREX-1 system phosphatase PglZ type B n=1 Tax=Falsiroseomonas algicola TaxID=2716930 RepID=A0A6M1LV47_9PROT|nr:BREX-1 system phosphatase PglZ type B [Falsiroseomonas algicola]NGM24331.1 BREX-1 system phosphatase PglZ type B [Falsiroseomonas algicola]
MTTPLDALIEALRAAAAHNPAAEAAPEAVVWCDPAGDFLPLLPALRARLPHLMGYGEHDPGSRTGPALWLRAAAVRRVPGVDWPPGEPPVIYLPHHGREVLRGAEDCPAELAPLVWFAVAGAFFGQPKQARDWTLRGFLAAQGSPVGLDIPEDKATREALARAASRLFAEPLAALRGKKWTAAELDTLLVPDPAADMLAWLDGALTPQADPARFDAFAALASRQLGFDPRKKSPQDGAARLAQREKNWAKVWDRFEQANGRYEGVVKLLRCEEPQSMIEGLDAYPIVNARAEADLRSGLRALGGEAADKARQKVLELERTHGWRRDTVWAKRGEARLAEALAALAEIAAAVALPAHGAQAMADAYKAEGWKVDAAALTALDLIRNGEDREAVVCALRAIYLPWLDAGAAALQALAQRGDVAFARPEAVAPTPGAVLLFVDGLRMDLAQRLARLLEQGGATVRTGWRWSGFPTVTATCKPLASPAAGLLGAGPVEDLAPAYQGKATTKPVLNKAVEAAGWACAPGLLSDAPLWVEGRSIDEAGEANGTNLVALARDILADIAETALRHAREGRQVRIVTDHGFLLMPQGLPHAELTPGLAEPAGKARRVVLLKEGAKTSYPRLPWSWNGGVLMATATGARAFYNGVEYAHGGVSPQECVLPVLDVTAEGSAPRVAITARWRGLMLKVRAEGGAGLMADVRVGGDATGPGALVTGPKTLDDAGEANLGVDLDHEGQTVCVVLYRPDAPADVVAKLVTKAGG